MTSIYIEIDDSGSKIKFNNSKKLDTKESIKIVKILNELSEHIVEQGIKNDAKKYFKKG